MIKRISFDEILPVWRDHLWVGRVSEIKPTNGLKYLGGYDRSIEEYNPSFFGVFIDDKCVGVNSGHATAENEYRSRGLFVFPEYRKNGIAQKLLRVISIQAKIEKKGILWSLPRLTALSTYKKFGFNIVSNWVHDLEFGPNVYVMVDIS